MYAATSWHDRAGNWGGYGIFIEMIKTISRLEIGSLQAGFRTEAIRIWSRIFWGGLRRSTLALCTRMSLWSEATGLLDPGLLAELRFDREGDRFLTPLASRCSEVLLLRFGEELCLMRWVILGLDAEWLPLEIKTEWTITALYIPVYNMHRYVAWAALL